MFHHGINQEIKLSNLKYPVTFGAVSDTVLVASSPFATTKRLLN
jgi:hypothetical protein